MTRKWCSRLFSCDLGWASGFHICPPMSVAEQGIGWLQVVGHGHHTKTFTYRNSFDSSLEYEMIGNEVKIILARAK